MKGASRITIFFLVFLSTVMKNVFNVSWTVYALQCPLVEEFYQDLVSFINILFIVAINY